MKRPNGVRATYAAVLLHVLLWALGALLSSIHWKKPIHSLQFFFAAAVWLVSSKRTITLR